MVFEMKVVGLGRDVASQDMKEIKFDTGGYGDAFHTLVSLAMIEFVGEAIRKGCLPVKVTSLQITLMRGEIVPSQFSEVLKRHFPELSF